MNQRGAQVGAAAVEKFFSAVVEMEDGTKKLIPVRAESPGAVYQQVKQMPGVRRVGKVSAVSRADYEQIRAGRTPVPTAPTRTGNSKGSGDSKRPEPRRSEPPESNDAGEPGDAGRRERWPGHVITGPRVVMHAKPSGGEQPFKHLKPPPERPKPPPLPQPAKPVAPTPVTPTPVTVKPAAAPVLAPSAQPAAPAPAAPAAPIAPAPTAGYVPTQPPAPPAPEEYRIVKSRRQEGEPYLLQRGAWGQQKGKRAFIVDWEKGFQHRQDAERHLEWVRRSAREMEELNQQQEAEEAQEIDESEEPVEAHAQAHAEAHV